MNRKNSSNGVVWFIVVCVVCFALGKYFTDEAEKENVAAQEKRYLQFEREKKELLSSPTFENLGGGAYIWRLKRIGRGYYLNDFDQDYKAFMVANPKLKTISVSIEERYDPYSVNPNMGRPEVVRVITTKN